MLAFQLLITQTNRMSYLKNIADLFEPEVWAIYIVGFATISIGVWQYTSKFKRSKKAVVFDELAKDIEKATGLVNNIDNDFNTIVDHLAKAANLASANFDPLIQSENDIKKEIDRRLVEIEETAEKQKQLLGTIYSSFREVLMLIKKVEKSTVVGNKSKMAARYLFYAAEDQYSLINASTAVFQSFSVTPALGEKPNISSDTFNSYIELTRNVMAKNLTIVTYLEDLEVILHNDLVKHIYNKAQQGTIPIKHLSTKGLTDKRVKDSLI